ncbi:polysaccharide biosynthesis/export family protein [Pseudoalteromonas denitrificans]|uniref:Polysaccharide export outer membrane protein n=1 Tax=Pseudoalteromonas denitrificans DSM 6059 TaxID=1123010 RepID=A0A1I1U184_9GAMM|nr:polysaccharide biosynthesis/export family protein [Pseudoalteromonas denitrificans]SFD64425.1 polysaccharide export outer membrane protein [Pseudoalteromonas denitrificans DSM 6059]
MNKLFLGLVLFYLSILGQVNAQDAYKLGPGDKIEIKVYGQDDLTVEALLGNSGIINYPFLGEIKVKGLTVKQVENLVIKGLKGDYLINPNVSTQVVEYRQFYIHGEVKQPGGYSYQPGMTINQAVALAGGLTERASKEKIFLFREDDKNKQLSAQLSTDVSPGDTITIEQRFF